MTELLAAHPDLLGQIEQGFRAAGLRVETESVEKGGERYTAAFDVSGPAARHDSILRDLVTRPGVHRTTRAS